MRHLIEKLVCGGFATGAFALMFGLLTTTAQGETDFEIELPSGDREASFVPFVPQGRPDGTDADSITEEPERSEPIEGGGPSLERAAAPELQDAESGTLVRVAPTAQMVAGGTTAKKKKKGRKCVEPTGQITETSTDVYEVEKALIDGYVDDLDSAARLAWTGWHTDPEGDVDGFVVKRIRCGSPLHEAGFRNGDVVHEVNGRTIDSIPSALRAYRRLKRKDVLKVDLTRKNGTSRQMRYELQ